MNHHGLTPAEVATIETCTPDFIAGVQYAMRLCQALVAEYQAEADLDTAGISEGRDYIETVASGAQDCAAKLKLRLFVMEYEGWIPNPEFLIPVADPSPECPVPSRTTFET